MTFDEYQTAAARTSGESSDLINGALGIAGEAGEVIELVKKHKYHGRDLDIDALAKELGDLLWYVAETASQAGVKLSDVAAQNVAKLKARHPDGFDPSYHGGDVLAGYEWDDHGCYWAPNADRADDNHSAFASSFDGEWEVYAHAKSSDVVARGFSQTPWADAESALRAHLEGKQ
jgi:NTP pyrophosphatase (non-canonical NTP hydrolase)